MGADNHNTVTPKTAEERKTEQKRADERRKEFYAMMGWD